MTNAVRRGGRGSSVLDKSWAERFFSSFLAELRQAGCSPDQVAKAAWKPVPTRDLLVSGPDRDLSFHKVEITPREAERYLSRAGEAFPVESFLAERKLIFVLLPGFTHHTLRYPAFVELVEPKQSPLEVLKLARSADDSETIETFTHRGKGAKLVYAGYPRSNASTDIILHPLFRLLHDSPSLRRWVAEEGYRIVLVGYSYGAPLALELLAAMESGELQDSFLLPATQALLTINGAIHGSYLADFVAHPETSFNVRRAVDLMRQFHFLGLPLGIRTEQEREDMVRGVEALGHNARRVQLRRIHKKMPGHLKYVSISAFLPAHDYDINPLRNFDDASMYAQSLTARDVSIYNDGQMVLEDTFLPKFPSASKESHIHLGAVRAHHWAVSWRTFNAGNNEFPRLPYYRALVRSLAEMGIG